MPASNAKSLAARKGWRYRTYMAQPDADDLYARLGVSDYADEAEIRSAWRQAAHKLHPDRGGRADHFQRVKEAYEVLSDPDRRATYDRTGEYQQEPDIDGLARQTLQSAFESLIADERIDASMDLVEGLQYMIQEEYDRRARPIAKAEKAIKRLQKLRRFRRSSEGDNLFHAALDRKIKCHKDEIEHETKTREVLKRSLEMLGDYEFEVEEPEPVEMTEEPEFSTFMGTRVRW